MSDSFDKQATWAALSAQARQRWQTLGGRERQGLQLAAGALALLLLWTVGLQPALRTLQEAPEQLTALDAELQRMHSLATEVRELREAPPVSSAQALQALRSASEFLGPNAKLSLNGDRAVLNFNGLQSDALQNWLGEVRSAARARPVEAQMQRGLSLIHI